MSLVLLKFNKKQNINGLCVATTSIVKREQKGNQTLDTVSQLHEIH
jgi:hypothetical protein